MRYRRTRYEAVQDKREAVTEAELQGKVADSMDCRLELVRRMHAGEMTLEQIQSELKAVKRNAKRNGLITRQQAFSRG